MAILLRQQDRAEETKFETPIMLASRARKQEEKNGTTTMKMPPLVIMFSAYHVETRRLHELRLSEELSREMVNQILDMSFQQMFIYLQQYVREELVAVVKKRKKEKKTLLPTASPLSEKDDGNTPISSSPSDADDDDKKKSGGDGQGAGEEDEIEYYVDSIRLVSQ